MVRSFVEVHEFTGSDVVVCQADSAQLNKVEDRTVG